MTKETHIQCRLCREVRPFPVQVSWIPSKFAERGRRLELKNDDGIWEDNWVVIEIYPNPLDSKVVEVRERDFKKHRKATGPTGHDVHGVVCNGFFKGATVRTF